MAARAAGAAETTITTASSRENSFFFNAILFLSPGKPPLGLSPAEGIVFLPLYHFLKKEAFPKNPFHLLPS